MSKVILLVEDNESGEKSLLNEAAPQRNLP